MGTKLVKISEEIYNKVKELAGKQGKTIREVVESSISLLLQGNMLGVINKEIKGVVSKDIVVQFDSICAKCKKPIKAGSVAHYIKITYTDNTSRSFLFHLNCYVEQFDESLAKAIIRREKIKTEIKSLEKYRSKLIKHISEELEFIDNKLSMVHRELEKIHGVDEYYELYSMLEDVKNLLIDIKQFVVDKQIVKEEKQVAKTRKKGRSYYGRY